MRANQADTHEEGATTMPTPRITGSSLLLRKIALSARARQYISDAVRTSRREHSSPVSVRNDGCDPYSECTTLAFGPHTYRILALTGACEGLLHVRSPLDSAFTHHNNHNTNNSSGMCNSDNTITHSALDDIERQVFTNIHRWGCITGIDKEDVAELTDVAAMTWPIPHAVCAYDDLFTSASRYGKSERERRSGGVANRNSAIPVKRVRTEDDVKLEQQRGCRDVNTDTVNDQDGDGLIDRDETELASEEGSTLCRQWWTIPAAVQSWLFSDMFHNKDVYTNIDHASNYGAHVSKDIILPSYFTSLARWCSASDEARRITRYVRQPLPMSSNFPSPSSSFAGTALSTHHMTTERGLPMVHTSMAHDRNSSRLSSGRTWGSRMEHLVQQRLNGPHSLAASIASPADRALVAHYLRRIAWLQRRHGTLLVTQPSSSRMSSSAGARGTAALTWDTLSEADRVRMEMCHVQQQRNRFSRSRRGGAEDEVTRNDKQQD